MDFRNSFPNGSTIHRKFGSWDNALSKAGIEKGIRSKYTKENLIKGLVDFYNEYGKTPTTRELSKHGLPTTYVYRRHFGSYKNALIEADIFQYKENPNDFCENYTDDELLTKLKEYMYDKTRIPEYNVIKDELKPNISTYNRHFYSIYTALEKIGFSIENQRNKDDIKLKEKMILKYKEIQKELGRTPSSRDIDNYSQNRTGFYSMGAYEFHFGTLCNLQIECGFAPTVLGKNKSNDELIKDLKELSVSLGRSPIKKELKEHPHMASEGKYHSSFGSWNNALKTAGLELNNNNYYSTKGTLCLSMYELHFANMLEKYDISYETEQMYKKHLKTDKTYRFDFTIDFQNKKYFIEIFGYTNNAKYDEKTKEKIKICKDNNFLLIEFYPEEVTSDLALLHKTLMNKLNIT